MLTNPTRADGKNIAAILALTTKQCLGMRVFLDDAGAAYTIGFYVADRIDRSKKPELFDTLAEALSVMDISDDPQPLTPLPRFG